jgi:formyltetrahydrofolate synthetase
VPQDGAAAERGGDRRDDARAEIPRRRDVKEVSKETFAALEKGLVNLERHVENVSKVYGIPCVVSINNSPSIPKPRSSWYPSA